MKKYFLIIALLTLIFALDLSSSSKKNTENEPSYLQLNKGDYNILLEKSELFWIGKKITLKAHSGTLQFKEGTISINDDGAIYCNITIDMTSINNTDMKGKWKRKLEEHLKSADFFSVDEYPIAQVSFYSTRSNGRGNKINFNGDLTIKGITHQISFTVNLLQSNPSLKVQTSLSFDRSKYDVQYHSGTFYENLGNKLILDNISLDILIVAMKEKNEY